MPNLALHETKRITVNVYSLPALIFRKFSVKVQGKKMTAKRNKSCCTVNKVFMHSLLCFFFFRQALYYKIFYNENSNQLLSLINWAALPSIICSIQKFNLRKVKTLQFLRLIHTLSLLSKKGCRPFSILWKTLLPLKLTLFYSMADPAPPEADLVLFYGIPCFP
jgi:hypothetical protein